MDGHEPPCYCWELSLGPVQEQPMLLTVKTPLQPLAFILRQSLRNGISSLQAQTFHNHWNLSNLYIKTNLQGIKKHIWRPSASHLLGVPMKGSIRWESANESHMYSWHFNLNFRFTTVCCVDQAGLEYRILLSHMTSGYYSYRHYTHTKVLTLTKTLCVQYLIQGFIHAKQTLLNTYIPKLLCTTGPKQ